MGFTHPTSSVVVVRSDTTDMIAATTPRRVALAHHWAVSRRGGEKVLERIAAMFPYADILTLVHEPDYTADRFGGRMRGTAIQGIAGLRRRYKSLLPLHAALIRRMRVAGDTDLVVTSDAALMKTLPVPRHAVHVCYCHSPPRYLWGLADQYTRASRLGRVGLACFGDRLRRIDRAAARRVDVFVANSQFVRRRIRRAYDRESVVVYPPVDVNRFRADRPRKDDYLIVGEMVPYKRIDLAVAACTRLNVPLTVVGDGSQRERLRAMAGPTVRFLGRADDATVTRLFETSRAFLMPGVEDFGITPVEAQAAGCPVIAIRDGGALETVVEGRTGAFFDEQTVDSLAEAIDAFRPDDLTASRCRMNAERFAPERFDRELSAVIAEATGDVATVRRAA